MIERREDLGLALKSRQPIRIVSHRWRQHLDRDLPFQIGVDGTIDLAHATGAE
jgi:hypothetical protein